MCFARQAHEMEARLVRCLPISYDGADRSRALRHKRDLDAQLLRLQKSR